MILLSIGSNLSSSFGDRFRNLDLATDFLKKNKINIINKSSYYETASYPDKTKPKFINIMLCVESSMDPTNIARIIISAEQYLERKREKKNDPRTCDIDIIDFNGEIKNFMYKEHNFTVPHKGLTSRNFVLYPLQEISPDWKHPQSNESINYLIKKLDDENKKSILKLNKS